MSSDESDDDDNRWWHSPPTPVCKRPRLSSPITEISLNTAFCCSDSKRDEYIMEKVTLAEENDDLIGDYSATHALPLVKNPRLTNVKCISCDVMSDLLSGRYSDVIGHYITIDCRYPYEYEGGHINGAVNVYEKEQLVELLMAKPPSMQILGRTIVVFYCEFSKVRAPNMYHFCRQIDRQRNGEVYPQLFYPEIYLLEGGYKRFFAKHTEHCLPAKYIPMHKDDSDDREWFQRDLRP